MAVFWSESTSAPMRNYRWQIQMDGFTGNTVVWWAKTSSVPSWDMSEVEHNYFDNKYYFPGRVTWQDLEVALVDPVSPSAVQLTHEILKNSNYVIPSSGGAKKTVSKAAAVGGLKQVVLTLLDTNGTTREQWTLQNAFIKAAKFGDLDYSNDDLRQITLTIKYDWAKCEFFDDEGNAVPNQTYFEKQSAETIEPGG